MRLGLGLGVDSITSQKIGAGFTGILDEYSGAAAAYSVRKLSSTYTGGALRVRRSSDDTEQDIGFDSNGDLDTTALTTFVNEDVNQYTSDFTSGNEDLGEINGTSADGVNILGVDNAYKFTLSGGNKSHIAEKSNLYEYGNSYTVSFDYYIPSGQTVTGLIGPIQSGNTGSALLNVTGSWQSVSANIVVRDEGVGNSNDTKMRFYAHDGTNFTVDADGDVFYLKNIVITQTTADGFVTKIYNQSGTGGTGRDLAQGTESKQAKIVNAGTLLTEGSKPCIKANIIGTTVYGTYALGTAYEIPQPSFSVFSVLAHGSTQTTYVMSGSTIASDRFLQSSGRLRYTINGSGNYDIYQTIDQTRAIDMYMNDGTLTYHQNNSEIGSIDVSASNGNSFEFKNLGSGGNNNNTEEFQELIIFPEDKDTQRGDIRDNMNTYFSVYS